MRALELDAPVVEHLRTDSARLAAGRTVGQTIDALRRNPPSERIVYFYVVDDDGKLLGVVPTRTLLLSPVDKRIEEVMVARVLTLPDTATVRDACEVFATHRYLALPVVDAERRLKGVVDIELYTDELEALDDAQKRADLFQAMGVHAQTQGTASAWKSFVLRMPWLTTNVLGGLACAALANVFKVELSRALTLALFIPVTLSLAESVSSQSVSLTLHVLHEHNTNWSFVGRAFSRELGTGLMLGVTCGAAVAGTALLFWGGRPVAEALLGGIAAGVTMSALFGMALPVLLKWLKLDPKVAAGPIALAAADVTTLLAYLGLARALLR